MRTFKSSDELFNFDTTGALKIPTGTDGQRPGSPNIGDLRYNTTSGGVEVWTGSWDAIGGGGAVSAGSVSYNNATSGLTATDVQAAIDEVEGRLDTAESDISTIQSWTASDLSYSNGTSGLTATDVQAAIDEVEGRIDTIEAWDATDISYNNATSGLTASQVQAAIDEIEGRVDTIEGAYITTADVTGQETIFLPAGAMIENTTNGAELVSAETTTNDVMYQTFNFDASTSESVQFAVQMPKSWNEGTLIAQFIWSHPSTATNFGVVWGIQARAFANSDPLDTAFGTAQEVSDTGGTTNDIFITAETSAITVAGTPAAEEFVIFRIYRDPTDGSDTMAVDARLHGVKIHYTTDALNDD